MNKINRLWLSAACAFTLAGVVEAATWPGFEHGMGIGGWLTNYKRFNVLPEKVRLELNEGDFEHFDTYITEADIERIKRWGFDHIRLGFDQIVLEETPGKYRERTFRKIDEFISWCGKHQLNVVLNLHKAVGNYCDIQEKVQLLDDATLQNRMLALWKEIERRYHDFPGLAFEILNEVRDVDPEKWNDLAERSIKAIREVNPERWIVIGPTCWNNPPALAHQRVWDDPKVVYTFHMYTPHGFTHQRGVLQAGQLRRNREARYPDVNRNRLVDRKDVRPFDRSYLADCLKPAFDFAAAHPEKILWLGEFGSIRHAPERSRVAYMTDVISLCREHGIPWCVWNYLSTPNDGNRFSLVDDDTREFLSDELLDACLGRGDRAAAGTMKFTSFNIWGPYFGNPVCERDLKIAKFLVNEGAELIALQECETEFWSSRLMTRLAAAGYETIKSGQEEGSNLNPLFYRRDRLELVEGGTELFAAADNPQGSKGFTWGVFRDKAGGGGLIAYSTHLWWRWDDGETLKTNDLMRVNNVKEILAKVATLEKKYGRLPVVGGGDLNITLNARKAGRVTPLETLEQAGYADAQYAVKDSSPWSSHHGDPQRDAQGRLKAFYRRGSDDPANSLDHVHYRGVEPIAFRVDRSREAMEASDHSPVTFDFRLRR